MFLQHEDIEELIRRRQVVMRTPIEQGTRIGMLDSSAHSYAYLLALRFQQPSNLTDLVQVLEQLTSEVAGARDAVENERALRRLG